MRSAASWRAWLPSGPPPASQDDVLSEMKEVLDLQRFYIESEKEPGENSDQVKNLDSRFHELLYNSCGSRPYADTLISLHKKIIKYRKASVTHHSRAVHAWRNTLLFTMRWRLMTAKKLRKRRCTM